MTCNSWCSKASNSCTANNASSPAKVVCAERPLSPRASAQSLPGALSQTASGPAGCSASCCAALGMFRNGVVVAPGTTVAALALPDLQCASRASIRSCNAST